MSTSYELLVDEGNQQLLAPDNDNTKKSQGVSYQLPPQQQLTDQPQPLVISSGDTFQLLTKDGALNISPQYSWYEPSAELELNLSTSKKWQSLSVDPHNGKRGRWAYVFSIASMFVGHLVLILMFMGLFFAISLNQQNLR